MRKFKLANWMMVHEKLNHLKRDFEREVVEGKGQARLTDMDVEFHTPVFVEAETLCKSIGFSKAAEHIRISLHRLKSPLQQFDDSAFANELQHIIDAIMAESFDHRFVQIYPDRVEHFSEASFGEAVIAAFPSAAHDIREAGNCLAVECNDAAVFHLMRVAEWGLRSLAFDRRITFPKGQPIELATWGRSSKA